MTINIRTEEEKDYEAIRRLLLLAFKQADEADLVERIRKSSFYLPELTFVLEMGQLLVGHLMLSTIFIDNNTETHQSLALAPVSILPDYQGLGFGGKLILHSLDEATKLGFDSIILLGHAYYYPRFGFEPTETWDIYPPFPVPSENFMGIELTPKSLHHKEGIVRYPDIWELDHKTD